jgi:uncharacterized protein with von Willebrand factor type A (vWA) domain
MSQTTLDYEIRKALEEAFRRGYSYGFQDGICAKPEDFERLEKEVLNWRKNLTEQVCSPASRRLRGVERKWFDHNEEGAIKDRFVEAYELILEEKGMQQLRESRKGKEGFDSEGNRLPENQL